ncbi:MAG: FmdB family transcriptional regulator [Actinobacteria bacterium]|nr:FmdB family transcriptional regulator [Actinomycetota bacterium]
MPTYVYKFVETGETIEVQQAFTDDALTEAVHPTSGQTMQVKKVFQPVGVTFKGGGFYKTDSRGGSSKSSSTSTSTSSSTPDTTSSTAASTSSDTSSSTSTTAASTPSSPAPAS